MDVQDVQLSPGTTATKDRRVLPSVKWFQAAETIKQKMTNNAITLMDTAVLLTVFLTKASNALVLLQSARTAAMLSSKGLNPAIMVEWKAVVLGALWISAIYVQVLLQSVSTGQLVTMELQKKGRTVTMDLAKNPMGAMMTAKQSAISYVLVKKA